MACLSQAKPAKNLEDDLLSSLISVQDLIDEDGGKALQQQDDDSDEDYDEEAAAQFWGFLAKHAGRYACKHLTSRPEVLEQQIDDWLDKDAKIMQEGDDDEEAEYQRWRFGRRIRKFFKKFGKKIRKIGRGVCKAIYHNVAEQDYDEESTPLALQLQQIEDYDGGKALQQQDDDSDEDYDEEAAAQFWGFLAKHAGRYACKHLTSRPEVLEQQIDDWLDKDAKVMQEDDDGDEAEYQRWRFGRRIRKFFKKFGKKIRKIGRGVCKAIYHNVAEQDYDEESTPLALQLQQIEDYDGGKALQQQDDDSDEDYDEEAAAQFWGFLAKHAGRYACKHLTSRPEVLEQQIDDWLDKDAKIMQEGDDEEEAEYQRWRFGRRIRKFFKKFGKKIRKIGRGVCKAIYHNVAEQDYDDEMPSYKVKIQQEDPEDAESQSFWRLFGRHAGRLACKYLKSRPEVLEQNIDTWLKKDAQVMEEMDDEDADYQRFRFPKPNIKYFIKKHGSTIRRIGRGVCKVIYRG